MIQSESKLFVADNSGAKLVLCIKVIGGTNRRYANILDIIKISVKKCIPNGKVKKGEIYYGLIIRTIKGIRRNDGSFLKFNDNSVILLNNKLEPIGTRIFGPVVRELRLGKFLKLASIASEVL